jgi:HEAT repeat protein
MSRKAGWGLVAGCLAVALILVLLGLRRERRTVAPALPQPPSQEMTRQRSWPVPNRPLPQRLAGVRPQRRFKPNSDGLASQSVEVRVQFTSALESKPSAELLELWLAQVQSNDDPLKMDFIADALATRLRLNQPDSAAVLSQLQGFFLDPLNPESARWQSAQILGQAATQTSLAALLTLLNTTEEPGSRAWLLEDIVKASRNNWQAQFHEDFADLLINAWQSPDTRSDALPALGDAIASVGAPKGLELLFSQIKTGGQTVVEFEQQADDKAWLAFASLEAVRNPAAIPLLNSLLTSDQPGGMASSAAGYCLAKMGRPEATSVLLDHLRTSPADLTVYAADWFSLLRDGESIQRANAALDMRFAAPCNRDALSAALSAVSSP